MQPLSIEGRQPPQSSLGQHLARRTLLVMLLVVLMTTVPAVVVTYLQLERQVWLRVEAAQASTLALYADERRRIAEMAALVARRPTLCALVEQGDTEALLPYLEEMRQGVRVESLAVVSQSRGALASAAASSWDFAALAAQARPSADFVVSGSPPHLLIVAADMFSPPPGCDPGDVTLVAVQTLDSVWMGSLAERTGVAQSLIVADVRIATSLAAAPDWSLNPSAAHQVAESGSACCTRGSSPGQVYYVGLSPLLDSSGQVVALSEVALPGRAIQAEMIGAIAILLGMTALAALIGFRLTVRLARRISQPLTQLAGAAARMGAGDLESPIMRPFRIREIDALARQLERARQARRQARQLNQRQRQRIEALLEATHDGIITLDGAGRVTSVSLAAEQIIGARAFDLLEKRALEVFRPAPGEVTTIAHLLQPPPGAPPIRHLVVLNGSDGPITLDIFASWLEPDPALPGVRERVIVFRDISEEAAVEALRGSFLANVSHEFRTPLASVIASAEVLVEEFATLSRDELSHLLDSIQSGTRHLRTLVDNLLESASVEAGRFRVSYRPTQLTSILDELTRTMEPLLRRRGQSLEIVLPHELPTIYADPERLSQVLINLVANASKFAPAAKPVTITLTQQAESVTIVVLDCGPGLPTGDFGDLFQRFVTGPRTHGAQYGIGLGLSVVKAIVEAHGGQVGAENRPEGGARIWFTLPLEPPVPCTDQEWIDPLEGDQPVAQHSDRG